MELSVSFEERDVEMLFEIGFMALSLGFANEAGRIFLVLQFLGFARESAVYGEAMARLLLGDFEGTIRLMREVSPSQETQMLLAIALMQQGEKEEAREIFSDLLRFTEDASMRAAIQNFLLEVELKS